MKRILHLDDDEEIITIIQLILGKNYTLRSLTDLNSVHEHLVDFLPDLVISDNFSGLPEASAALMQYAKESGKPVILFSALPDLAERAVRLGLKGFIEKPSSISYIRSYVRSMLNEPAI